MNANLKSWLKLSLVAITVGLLYFWVNGIPGSAEKDIPGTGASQSVPAPGPSQKKVLLKDLGMT